jgi:hypothetical protein
VLFLALFGAVLAGLGFAIPKEAVIPRYETKSIEEIRAGDAVLARQEHGGHVAVKPVVETYRRTADHLRLITFADAEGRLQLLKTTDEHPFWLEHENRWVKAKDLKKSDRVVGPHGEIQLVSESKRENHPHGVTVYNFKVADFHTYYVRQEHSENPPILVHNAEFYHYFTPKPGTKPGDVYATGYTPGAHWTTNPNIPADEAAIQLGTTNPPTHIAVVQGTPGVDFTSVAGSQSYAGDWENVNAIPGNSIQDVLEVIKPGGPYHNTYGNNHHGFKPKP